jgi:hypothetical protein
MFARNETALGNIGPILGPGLGTRVFAQPWALGSAATPITAEAPASLLAVPHLVLADAGGPMVLVIILGLGLWAWRHFSGIRCPACGRRRNSHVVDRRQVDQYIGTRVKELTSRTVQWGNQGRRVSKITRQVPVRVTIRKFLETRNCAACGKMFQRVIEEEA